MAINAFLIGLILGTILGAGVGVAFYRRYKRTGKIPMVDRFAGAAERAIRKPVVVANMPTNQEMEKMGNEENGWGNLLNDLKGPAEGVEK